MHAPDALTALGRISSEACDVTVVTREIMQVPPHSHDTTNHVLVTEGCLWLTMAGIEQPVRPGQWCCIPAGTEHAERFAERTSAVVFWLRGASS
ncbi:MAG TPA: cupin domain-containing protein [Denitromonas sp.]|uniref:cupin domain-containing protein n=1 Tax=Denitromonas sp. TaxID=2734609 RepID=UPI001D9F369F|nr:cupin domain-containing protein [Rhodocyclaceae bacterium]MCP5223178.1 cupin domain-containing protein [Zoogloeaceae bacterium]HQU89005.1 cupin domain-containing protein [Denitromonas sp.]HQV14511.1 cupin domain-containing protein [Denitromonas sp.]